MPRRVHVDLFDCSKPCLKSTSVNGFRTMTSCFFKSSIDISLLRFNGDFILRGPSGNFFFKKSIF